MMFDQFDQEPEVTPVTKILANAPWVSLVALVGLIVLTAMNKVSADVSIPLIAGFTGVHINTSTPTQGG